MGNIAEVSTVDVTDECDFVLLATDGLWDVMSNDDAVSFVHAALNGHLNGDRRAPPRGVSSLRLSSFDDISSLPGSPSCAAGAACAKAYPALGGAGDHTPRHPLQTAVEALVNHASIECHSSDNVSAVVLQFVPGVA
jgi:serine/threonine protein phosphatase PrpC